MQFTYDSYRDMLNQLNEHEYIPCSYHNWKGKERCVILRHDIDNDLSKALQLAEFERDAGVQSTYFVLVTSDFYNIFSTQSEKLIRAISECGHEVGLHFDEVRYPEIRTPEDASERIKEEAKLLSIVTGSEVTTVSMHRPSKMMLEADLEIAGMINSYGQVYFKGFKYLSDSRRRWREPVNEIIDSGAYERLHILTHAIWYNDSEIDIHDSVEGFINAGNRQRYETMRSNITDLPTIMREDEIR